MTDRDVIILKYTGYSDEELKSVLYEKEISISKLQTQIEKMKNCGNCKYWEESFDDASVCAKCEKLSKWELAEMTKEEKERNYKWCRLFGSDEQFHDDIEDVIQEYLSDNDLEEDEAKDIELEIEFGEEDENFKWNMGVLEDLLERLDQELGVDGWTEPTDAMKKAEKNLIEVVKKEYPVRPVKECGVKTIRIGDYL